MPTFTDSRITESSGFAFSLANPTVPLLWTHNDEATTPNLFGVNGLTGATVSTITWKGDPGLVDPEAISLDLAGRIWHADLGDNTAVRDHVRLLMAPEPTTLGDHTNVDFSKFLLVYPDGPRNAETFLTRGLNDNRYVISKETSSHLYLVPPLQGNNVLNELQLVDDSMGAFVADGTFSTDGQLLYLLRKDEHTTIFVHNTSDWGLEGTFSMSSQDKPEGITADPDGLHVWVTNDHGGSGGSFSKVLIDPDFQPGPTPPPVLAECA